MEDGGEKHFFPACFSADKTTITLLDELARCTERNRSQVIRWLVRQATAEGDRAAHDQGQQRGERD